MENEQRHPRRRRAGALRDLTLIALVAAVLLWLGQTTNLFDAVNSWIGRHLPIAPDDVIAGSLLAIGFGIFAARRWLEGRKQAATRDEAERRLRTLVEHIPAIAYAWDSTLSMGTPQYGYVSPQIEAMLGYPCEDWESDPQMWIRTLHPDDRERVVAESDRTDATGEPFSMEYRVVAKDGRIVWVRDEAVPVAWDASGRATLFQGVLIDVTERRVTDDALRRRDAILEAVAFGGERFLASRSWEEPIAEVLARLGEAAEVSRVYVFENHVGPDGALLTSQRYEWVAEGVVPEIDNPDMQGFPWQESGFDGWADRLAAGEVVAGHIREMARAEREVLGAQGIVSILQVPIFVAGTWWGYIGFDECFQEREFSVAEVDALKVSAGTLGAAIRREHAEGTLAEREALLRTIFETEPECVKLVAPDGSLLEMNRAGLDMIEADSLEQVRGRSLSPVVVPEHREAFEALVAEVFRGGRGTLEFELVGLKGTRRWLETHAVPLLDAEGEIGALLGITRDVTERKRAELQVRLLETIALTIAEAPTLDEALESALRMVCEATGWILGKAWLPRPDGSALEPGPSWCATEAGLEGFLSVSERAVFAPGVGLPGRVWASRRSAWIPDVTEHPNFPRAAAAREAGLRAAVGAPVLVGDEVVAVMEFFVRDEREEEEKLVALISAVAAQLGGTIRRRQAEEGLRKAEAEYRTLVERIPAVVYSAPFGENAPWRYVSPQIESILGYTAEEWMADPSLWVQRIHPEDLTRVLEHEDRSRHSREPFVSEHRMIAKDGRVVWVRDEAEIVPAEGDDPDLLRGLMLDVTEQREAEKQLRETEAKYRVLVEQIPAVLYIDFPDRAMTPIYVSPQVEKMLGISQHEYVAGDLWEVYLHPEDRERTVAESLIGLESDEPFSVEYRMVRPDGREVWIHDEAVVVSDDEGRPSFVQGVMFDITERKHAEEVLQESEQREREAAERLRALDKMKNTFLSAVSHELRSPLTSILGLALTLEQQELAQDDRQDLLVRLASNARKLDRLLKDLLDIDRLNRGILTPQYRPTDIGGLVRRTVKSLEMLAARSVVVEADPVVISADPAKVERIVENLLANVVRHTTPDIGIWVRVRAQDGGVLIAVEDDGPGVPKELQQEIFEPFRQGPTASPHAPGTGIGLSLVAMFAGLHGGRAWVQDREGGGASFRVFLPGAVTRGDGEPIGGAGPLESSTGAWLDTAGAG